MLSTGRLATELGCSTRTIERAIADGRLVPAAFTAGGHARFSREQADTAKARGLGPVPSAANGSQFVRAVRWRRQHAAPLAGQNAAGAPAITSDKSVSRNLKGAP